MTKESHFLMANLNADIFVSQACFMPLMRIGTITLTLRRYRADSQRVAGALWLRGKSVSVLLEIIGSRRFINKINRHLSQGVLTFDLFLSVAVCFKVFDIDRDGVLSRDEIHEMVVALLEVWKDNRTDTLPVSRDELIV